MFTIEGPRRIPSGGSGRVHCLIPQGELLKMKKNGQFPDEVVRIKGGQIHYVVCNLQTY
jgi:hypothetical protein